MPYLTNHIDGLDADEKDLIHRYAMKLAENVFVATCIAHELLASGEIVMDDMADHMDFICAISRFYTDKEMHTPDMPKAELYANREKFFTERLKNRCGVMHRYEVTFVRCGSAHIQAYSKDVAKHIAENMSPVCVEWDDDMEYSELKEV